MGPPRPVLPFGPTNVHSRRRARRVRVGRPVMAQRHGPIWRETRTRGRLPSCLHHPPSASSARSAERRRRRRRRLPPSDWNKHVPASGPAQARFALPSECADCVPTASSLHRAETTRDGTPHMSINAAQGKGPTYTSYPGSGGATAAFQPFFEMGGSGGRPRRPLAHTHMRAGKPGSAPAHSASPAAAGTSSRPQPAVPGPARSVRAGPAAGRPTRGGGAPGRAGSRRGGPGPIPTCFCT